MDDWITALISILGPIIGVVVGYRLATVSARSENKNNVERLRRLIYTDVLRIFLFLAKIVSMTDGYLKDPKIKTDDAETLNALLQVNRAATERNLSNEWYRSARAEPFIFSQLSKKEQDAINRIYDLQLLTTNEGFFNAALKPFSKNVDKSELPKVQFFAEKISREDTVKQMMKAIRGGLDEGLLLDVSTGRSRELVTLIFKKQEPEDALPDIEEASAKL